jgi:hypothetical protein
MNAMSALPSGGPGSETYFELSAMIAGPFRVAADSDLERLKHRLLRQKLSATTDPEFYAPLRRAANEAASLAWTTPYATLVFPILFEEYAEAAVLRARRQQRIRRRSRDFVPQSLELSP